MIRSRSSPAVLPGCIPRESGDDPVGNIRGWFVGSVFPARAGMIRFSRQFLLTQGSIPRESGDDPSPLVVARATGGYSPRERG